MKKIAAFYWLAGSAIALYFSTMVVGIPDHKYGEHTERSIGVIMRALLMTPMAIIIPLAIIGGLYLTVRREDENAAYGESIFAFAYSLLSLLAAIFFFILAQRHDEYRSAAWIYLSSSIILFVSIFFLNTGEEESLNYFTIIVI